MRIARLLIRSVVVVSIAIVVSTASLGIAEEKNALCSVLVTGFGPFGGRQVNGSSIAAKSLAGRSDSALTEALIVPVVWGEPKKQLEPLLKKNKPSVLICLGEGYPGFFTIEAVAHNQRQAIKDVKGNLPPDPLNEKGGPDEIRSTAPVIDIAKAMTEQGFPTHVSTDAGGYLCEEMLYTIERLKKKHPGICLVFFVHMPPQGAAAFLKGRMVKTDPKLVRDFAKTLLKVALKVKSQAGAKAGTK